MNTLKTLIGVTVGFVLCFGLYLVLRAEYYMENIVGMDLMAFARNVLMYYVIVLVIFAVISIVFLRVEVYRYTEKGPLVLSGFKSSGGNGRKPG